LIEIVLVSLEINFPNEIRFKGMNADLSDPVKFHALSFSNNSGTLSNLADFLRSLETEMDHRSQQDQMMAKGRKARLDSLQKGEHSRFMGKLLPL